MAAGTPSASPPSVPQVRPVDHLFYPHPLDRPLAGAARPDHPFHLRLYACEFMGTVVLMLVGIVTNVLIGAAASPLAPKFAGHPVLRVGMEGLFFGAGGTLAALSPFGRVSGGHVSPSVSFAFALASRLAWRDMVGYMLAQCAGAVAGTALLALAGRVFPAWGHWAVMDHYAGTVPNPAVPASWPFMGEAGATMLLIAGVLLTGSHARLRWLTPLLSGPLFFMLNPFEAWLSGDSTNLARSLGPAVFSGQWHAFWIYCTAPFCGAALAVVLLVHTGLFGRVRVLEARVAHFGHHGRAPFLLPRI
ncbi:MIP/aquaporin family protein [Komagataeibacter saccharivorans]|uniref:MIP/aquaporin family protein n=1 Tax=Komagataeibacter saccharivorans TaxID=265959 RepID=UPI0039E90D62